MAMYSINQFLVWATLGIGDEQGRTTCKDAHKFRGCPITYTVDRYEPPRS